MYIRMLVCVYTYVCMYVKEDASRIEPIKPKIKSMLVRVCTYVCMFLLESRIEHVKPKAKNDEL